MKNPVEGYLLSLLELAIAAAAPGATVELRGQAAMALRLGASMLDGGGAIAAAAPAMAAASSTAAAASSTAAAPAAPDFISTLLGKVLPLLPEGALQEANAAAREEGFRMPMGIDLEKFVAQQAASAARAA